MKRQEWIVAAWLAVIAAICLEFGLNVLERRTVWHRIDALEHRLQQVEKKLHMEHE